MNEENQEDKYSDPNLIDKIEIVVDNGQSPIRIDLFLAHKLSNISRSKIQNSIKKKEITVNSKFIKSNYVVGSMDKIVIELKEPRRINDKIIGENIPLNIIYEDEQIIVIDKQAGLVVHPAHGNYSGTLVNAITYYLENHKLPRLQGNSHERAGLVHRIDKDTTGLMVLAKTEPALKHLGQQFFQRTIQRSYHALVWGDVEKDDGIIDAKIGRHPVNRIQQYVYQDDEQYGKPAITHYKVIERLYYVTLVKCILKTGRTHQIRVHMKYLGHTLFNDERYGGNTILKGTVFSKYKQFVQNTFKILPRQALHAATLGFVHPTTNEELFFESPLPDDFSKALEKWRHYTEYRKEFL